MLRIVKKKAVRSTTQLLMPFLLVCRVSSLEFSLAIPFETMNRFKSRFVLTCFDRATMCLVKIYHTHHYYSCPVSRCPVVKPNDRMTWWEKYLKLHPQSSMKKLHADTIIIPDQRISLTWIWNPKKNPPKIPLNPPKIPHKSHKISMEPY